MIRNCIVSGPDEYGRYKMKIFKPIFTTNVFELDPLNLYELSLGVSSGILTDGNKVAFVKQTVTCAYAIAGKLGFNSVDKACKAGVMNYEQLNELRIGRHVFRRGDIEKADEFRRKFNIEECGPTTLRSYDLRGEHVR